MKIYYSSREGGELKLCPYTFTIRELESILR
jgi:hypothetical protein